MLTLGCLGDIILYLTLPTTFIAIVVVTKMFAKLSVTDTVTPDGFFNILSQDVYEDMIFGMEGMAILLLVARILCVFRNNLYIDLIISTFTTAFNFLAAFAIFFFVIVSCCGMITQSMWGTFATEFGVFWKAMFNVLLAFGGNMKYSTWLHVSSAWSYVYFVLFFLWVAFLFPFIFIGIYLESYRITALELGYPESNKKNKWGPKDYLVWVLDCLPESVKHKLNVPTDTAPEKKKD